LIDISFYERPLVLENQK